MHLHVNYLISRANVEIPRTSDETAIKFYICYFMHALESKL